jgi:hypothetical protein
MMSAGMKNCFIFLLYNQLDRGSLPGFNCDEKPTKPRKYICGRVLVISPVIRLKLFRPQLLAILCPKAPH